MPRKKKGPEPIRGGSGTARARGLVGVLFYCAPAERNELKAAAGSTGAPLAHFVRDSALAAARRVNGGKDSGPKEKKDQAGID